MTHTKIRGFIEEINDDSWSARLFLDGEELYAEMEPEFMPPPHLRLQGLYFTIHTTKRGQQYIYFIDKPLLTKRQLKKARIWARETMKVLGWDDQPACG